MPSDTARRLHREHLARQRRLAEHAVPDAGIHMHNGRPVVRNIRGLVSISGPVSAHFIRWRFPYAVALIKLEFALGSPLSIDQIVREVCFFYKIPRIALLSHRRFERFTRPRHVAM